MGDGTRLETTSKERKKLNFSFSLLLLHHPFTPQANPVWLWKRMETWRVRNEANKKTSRKVFTQTAFSYLFCGRLTLAISQRGRSRVTVTGDYLCDDSSGGNFHRQFHSSLTPNPEAFASRYGPSPFGGNVGGGHQSFVIYGFVVRTLLVTVGRWGQVSILEYSNNWTFYDAVNYLERLQMYLLSWR